MRLLVCDVRDGANHHERYAEVVANVRNRGRFHLNGNRLREVMTDFCQTDGAIDERITADNQAAYRVKIELSNAGFSRRNQFVVSFKPCRAARELTVFVAKRGDVGIVITRFVGDNDIAHFQRRRQAASRTGVHDHVRLAALKQQGRTQRSSHFTDA